GHCGLVNFDSQLVIADVDQARADQRREERVAVVRRAGPGQRRGRHRPEGHVAPENLDLIQVDDRAVVAAQAHQQIRVHRRVEQVEMLTKIKGEVGDPGAVGLGNQRPFFAIPPARNPGRKTSRPTRWPRATPALRPDWPSIASGPTWPMRPRARDAESWHFAMKPGYAKPPICGLHNGLDESCTEYNESHRILKLVRARQHATHRRVMRIPILKPQ